MDLVNNFLLSQMLTPHDSHSHLPFSGALLKNLVDGLCTPAGRQGAIALRPWSYWKYRHITVTAEYVEKRRDLNLIVRSERIGSSASQSSYPSPLTTLCTALRATI